MVMEMTKTAAMRPSSFDELEVAAAGTALRAATVNALEADSANVRSVEMVCVAMNVSVIRLCAELLRETTRKMEAARRRTKRRRKMSNGGRRPAFLFMYIQFRRKNKLFNKNLPNIKRKN